jgi:hypothetical protein
MKAARAIAIDEAAHMLGIEQPETTTGDARLRTLARLISCERFRVAGVRADVLAFGTRPTRPLEGAGVA